MSGFLRIMSALMILSFAGCSWFGGDEQREIKPKGPSLGKKLARLPELELQQVAATKPSRDEVMAAYNRVYGMLPSAHENHAVGKRLADLHMAQGEELDIAGQANPYDSAVSLYESLLTQAQDGEGVDEILYQLARAYDLATDRERTLHYLDRLILEYPQSEFIPEGRFRRAEIRFSDEDYRSAAADYGYVVELGDSTPYYRNASYMLGWSEFKRSRFDEGLEQFFNVVDDLLAEGDSTNLAGSEKELLNDSFRVVTLALAYLDGAQTLADEMRRRGKPQWQYLAYEKLAADYFDKERFLDNVATWQTFIEHNSLDPRAPAAHTGMIKTLMDAGFPSDVIPKKKEFVLRYGVYSEFWDHHSEDVRQGYVDTLHTYLSELAKLSHAEAQAYDQQYAQGAKEKPKARYSEARHTELYLAAAEWYEQLIATFPEDPRTAEFLFLLGESYTEASQHGRAVAAYQRVVRDFLDYAQAHEAGYAAILGLTELVDSSDPGELELWRRLKIDAQIEFALLFADDPRAPAVQTDAADTLFTLGHADEAIGLAENLLAEWPDVEPELRKTALLIIGHGRFEADEFILAEDAYHQLLAMNLSADEQQKVHQRLLASVYKQAETLEAAGDVDGAVANYLRVASIDPSAALAAQAHFDAVAAIEGTGRVAQAAELLQQFRQTYPRHELARGLDMRLAAMYEKTGDLAQAATEYLTLSQRAPDKDARRQAKYRVAEIYLELDDVALAIEHFRDYAHTYKQPRAIALEAIHHMDELYQRTGEPDKRRFWLGKKIETHRAMGSNATQRSTYLAASAQFVFAGDEKQKYNAIRLTHPLKRSLKKKQAALKKTLQAYEAAADYKVAEFATASTFEIADLYRALSKSIMRSDRPQKLSELELAQYEILLEEQAFPFEEQAISLHEINQQKAWSGIYDDWVKKSFVALAELMPGRFNKPEQGVRYAESIH